MRIAIATWTRRLAGGVEGYLAALVPALLRHGHDVALLHEVDDPHDRSPIVEDDVVPQWCADGNRESALVALRGWKPDAVFVQGLDDPVLESNVAAIAPAVLFAHNYRGTCVSGTKCFSALPAAPCDRRMGWPCLLHYLPRRCGGLSPVTMMRLYLRESKRRGLFGHYAGVVTFSEHMRREYIRHGVSPERAHRLPCHVGSPGVVPRRAKGGALHRILFAGRMEALKGGDVLLEALPIVQQALGRPLHVTFAGDGQCRAQLEAQAERLFPPGAETRVEFTGWLGVEERDRLLTLADLLVMPSLWPEPFGLIGVEAASYGVPAAAFDAGGIREWLHDGVSGCLAPANPPRAGALASAIVRCLRDPAVHAELSRGALRISATHSMEAHLAALLPVLRGQTGVRPGTDHHVSAAEGQAGLRPGSDPDQDLQPAVDPGVSRS